MANKEFVWVYNPKQAIYYIKQGLIPLDLGTGSKGDAFLKFPINDQYKALFRAWCDIQHDGKN